MSWGTLMRQVARRGPVACHYRQPSSARPTGYKLSHSSHGVLLTFGTLGHYFGLGWMVD